MLYSQLDEETELRRPSQLSQKLKAQKRILIILDDIWEELDLRKSRNFRRGTQRNFLVEHLSEEEAWRLFKKTAGDSTERPDLQSIAIEVAKECAGLPFAIVAVAKALRNMSLYKWKDALQQLKRSVKTSIRGIDEIIYSSLKLSYEHLSNNEARSLFLLCGLLGYRDIPMGHLLKYSIGLALLEGVDTLEEEKKLHRLTGFYPGSQTLEKLHPGDFDHPMTTLFNEKVAFPRLEVLEISTWMQKDMGQPTSSKLLSESERNEGQDLLHLEKHLSRSCEIKETADDNGGEASSSVFPCVDEISEGTSGGHFRIPLQAASLLDID
ncbi:hypothetical protein AAG906_006538 [Vitis piasezkii]